MRPCSCAPAAPCIPLALSPIRVPAWAVSPPAAGRRARCCRRPAPPQTWYSCSALCASLRCGMRAGGSCQGGQRAALLCVQHRGCLTQHEQRHTNRRPRWSTHRRAAGAARAGLVPGRQLRCDTPASPRRSYRSTVVIASSRARSAATGERITSMVALSDSRCCSYTTYATVSLKQHLSGPRDGFDARAVAWCRNT